jgi:hypothetical protein
MGDGDSRSALAFQGRSCKLVPFDEPLHRLHCLIEELEIPEE